MSNHLAVATVTAALRQAIQDALDVDVDGAKAQVGRPESGNGADTSPVVNLFLYQAVPNAAGRNMHLPSRGGDGRSRAPSTLAMDLHYLISFYGATKTYDPERLLGSATRALEHKPLITRALIEKVIKEDKPTLGTSDLAHAVEAPRASPLNLSLEELSKLWSVLFQVPYVLSVAYKLGMVLVEATEGGSSGPPITSVGLGTRPMGGPAIEAIEAGGGPLQPIVWGGKLMVRGDDLARPDLELRLNGIDAALANATRAADRIELTLDAATLGGEELAAGAVLVQTVLPAPPGISAHLERVTDSATFVLRPQITLPANPLALDAAAPDAPVDGTITLNIAPKVQLGQTARLFLDERAATAPIGRQFVLPALADDQYPLASLKFPFTKLKRSTYYAQVGVEGVASAPVVDLNPASATFRQIVGPLVTIP